MKVIGCRGAASWAVIKNRPVRTEIGCELEEGIDLPPDSLGMVVETGYGEVKRENRHGIAEDQVFVPVPEAQSPAAKKLINEAAKMALADEELSCDEKDAIMNLGMQLGYSKLDVQQVINFELNALKNRSSRNNKLQG